MKKLKEDNAKAVRTDRQQSELRALIKNLFMLSVRISSYGCTREVWRARKMSKICTRLSPRATLAS